MDLLDIVLRYWPIIVAFIGLVASYVDLKLQNKEQERRIYSLECDSTNTRTLQSSIETRLTQIQTDLEWIKKALK